MDDLQRPPSDGDREQLAARIKRVCDEGRIGAADRDIRLGNVRSAQSMTELDLMTRELDQLEASVPASGVPATGSYAAFDPKAARRSIDVTAGGGPGRLVAVIGVVVALVLLVGAVVAVLGNRIGSTDEGPSTSPGAPADPGDADPQEADDPAPEAPAGPAYSLTAKGVTDWLAAYRQKFGTALVYDLTFYEHYVIVNAPVPGKARQSGWLYREDRTWTGFGGVRATFPGAMVVNTRRLDVPAMMRNVARARRTLNVEKPAQAYVIIRHYGNVDQRPSVDVHVTNEFQESGYLATTLAGQVERAYPYTR